MDPEFVFITGWNEWIAQRFLADKKRRVGNDDIDVGGTFFVGLYDHEYSRDAEPMKGGYEDNTYYQMVANIRRFKGVDPPEVFVDDLGDTRHRNHPGYASAGPYLNRWGRNDITACEASGEPDGSFRFSVRTAEPLTDPEGTTWMNLLAGVPGSPSDSWNGFQHRFRPLDQKEAEWLVWDGGEWTVKGRVPVVSRRYGLTLHLPSDVFGSAPERIEFKWFDNMPEPLDILDFMDHGDTAPNNRFRYSWKIEIPQKTGRLEENGRGGGE